MNILISEPYNSFQTNNHGVYKVDSEVQTFRFIVIVQRCYVQVLQVADLFIYVYCHSGCDGVRRMYPYFPCKRKALSRTYAMTIFRFFLLPHSYHSISFAQYDTSTVAICCVIKFTMPNKKEGMCIRG